MDQGMQAASRSWKRQEMGSSLEPPEGVKSSISAQERSGWNPRGREAKSGPLRAPPRSDQHSAGIYWMPTVCQALFWMLGMQQWRKHINPCPHGADIPVGKTYNKQSNKMPNIMASGKFSHQT